MKSDILRPAATGVPLGTPKCALAARCVGEKCALDGRVERGLTRTSRSELQFYADGVRRCLADVFHGMNRGLGPVGHTDPPVLDGLIPVLRHLVAY
jgi:hypothetical protein